MGRATSALALLFALLAAASGAGAVTQPDGTVIPQGSEVQSLFASRGEPLDARADAAITPERFVPGCVLTFTLVTRGPALFQNSFGWYNVTGSPPDESDLHVLIPCDARPGFVATLDLRREAAYRGGEIGFFLRTPQAGPSMSSGCSSGDCCGRVGHPGYTYYTERAFNPDNVGTGSYIHLLIYDSRITPRAFYFAWEDLYGGGDNQFTDFVAQVSNIVCSGAGGACDTGLPGVCAAGTEQCRAGVLQCVGNTGPSAEMCDGLDNDCDGMTDEGDGLCPDTQLCERGGCVERCIEQSCFPGEVCTPSGACVEAACATVDCPSGQRCVGGTCVGACEGVVCPRAQVCRAGRCVDPCAGLSCDPDQVCEAGVCVPRCECRRCGTGRSCAADGRCIEEACAAIRCPPGSNCVGGICRDACEGVRCPRSEQCVAGICVTARPDAGVLDGGHSDAADATTTSNDGAMDAGRDVAGDSSFELRTRGCVCSVPGCPRGGRLGAVAFGACAALFALLCRMRASRSPR